MPSSFHHHPSSYRDPSGFIFEKGGMLYRQVNRIYKGHFDHLIESGCYQHLAEQGLLIPHEQLDANLTGRDDHYITLKPEKLSFVSYPYEWSFDMLKDAALLTLQLLRESLKFGMILKDASPYNIQWHKGNLIFIDSLSFEKYQEKPWIAYRQFCECFLGPLLLMHYRKQPLQPLQLAWPDGIPLPVIRSLLPGRSRFSLHTYLHIHLHATVSFKPRRATGDEKRFSKQKLLNLITSLETLVRQLELKEQNSTWSHYYKEASQRNDYLAAKKDIVRNWLNGLPGIINAIDLGANEGEFSLLTAEKNIQTLSADFDPYCVNRLYSRIKTNKETNIQPLLIDLANPSPGIGLLNKERLSFLDRTDADLAMALALIHHLAIGRNIPFTDIADLFCKAGKFLLLEFVPKDDEKIKLMLLGKQDIYTEYTEDNFIKAFERLFSVEKREIIPGSERILFLMKRK